MKGIIARVVMLAALVLASATARAYTNEFVAELNTEYTLTSGETYYFSFTATQEAVYVLQANVYVPRPYSDAEITTQKTHTFSYGGTYGQQVEFSMEEGETVYFCSGNYGPWSDVTFMIKISGSDGLVLERVSQEEGGNLDITSNAGLVTLSFNMNVSASSAIIQSGTNTATLDVHTSGIYLSFETKDVVYSWLQSGAVEAGDKVTITISGVCASNDNTILYNGDGTLTLTYYLTSIPVQLSSETIPSAFLSYWLPGDEDGILTLVFDGDLATGDEQTATATLSFGSAEDGDYYVESLDVAIDGATLTIDFTDKLRTKSTMNISGDYTSMSLKIATIRAADGTLVYSSGQGTTGSYSYSMDYTEVSSDITAEFTPADRESIADVSTIEIWLSDKTVFTYEGVLFESGDVSIVVAKEDVEEIEDGIGNGIALTVSVPDEVKSLDDVEVSLYNVLYADGLDHDISATYNYVLKLVADFVPTTIDPEGGEGNYVTVFRTMTLTFPETACLNTDLEAPFVFTESESGATIEAVGSIDSKDDKIVTLSLKSAMSNKKTYVLSIAEGAIGDSEYSSTAFVYGRCNPYTEIVYDVNAAFASAEFLTDPLDGATVSELSTITILKDDVQGPSYSEGYGIYLYDEAGDVVAEGSLEDVPSVEGELIITLSNVITTSGTYTLEIQDSVFNYGSANDMNQNAAYTVTYYVDATLTGIASLKSTTAGNSRDVYDLTGRRVRTINDEAELDALRRGVYIIKGKKTIVK